MVAKTFLYFCGVICAAFHRHGEIEASNGRHFVITALLGVKCLANKRNGQCLMALEPVFVGQEAREHPTPFYNYGFTCSD